MLSVLTVKSVIDVGCGVGPWAAEFMARGIEEVWGVDGDYVDRAQLRIPKMKGNALAYAFSLVQPTSVCRLFSLS